MIWFLFALLAGAAVLAVLLPLAGKSAPVDAGATERAFYREQIAEIERERAEGRLEAGDAEAARTEAARRLLRAEGERSASPAGSSRQTRIAAALATALLAPAGAALLYLHVGSPQLPDQPLAERLTAAEAAGPHADLSTAVARIEAHLAQHPEDGRGFEVVAPYYLRNGRYEQAIHAFGEALRLLGATPARHAALGEAFTIAGQGEVTPEALREFEAALALDAKHPMSRYYVALAAAQKGDAEKALALWSELLAEASPNAGYRKLVQAQIDRLKGPEEGAEAAKASPAMSESDQQAMIRGMVARLAERLAQKGDDVEGWLKLMRAYAVLSEPEKAKTALLDARKALAGKPEEAARVNALAADLGIERKAQQ